MNSSLPLDPDAPYEIPLDWMFHPRFVVAPMQVRIDGPVLAELTAVVEHEIHNPARKSYGHRLAGVIRHGEQIEATASLSNRFKSLLSELSQLYLTRLVEANGVHKKSMPQSVFREGWIVVSRAGDYNPVHKHSAQLSGIVYVKVPPQVADPATSDGKLHFLFGQQQESNLVLLGNRLIIPRVGDLYIFPSWLQHVVYPFEGPGERVSFAFNLNAQNLASK